MEPQSIVTDETPRIWAAAIEQVGALVLVAVQFVVAQHLYATYVERKPETSWLMKGWKQYETWQMKREQARIGWINHDREAVEFTPQPHGS
jgi:hypothetical protein